MEDKKSPERNIFEMSEEQLKRHHRRLENHFRNEQVALEQQKLNKETSSSKVAQDVDESFSI